MPLGRHANQGAGLGHVVRYLEQVLWPPMTTRSPSVAGQDSHKAYAPPDIPTEIRGCKGRDSMTCGWVSAVITRPESIPGNLFTSSDPPGLSQGDGPDVAKRSLRWGKVAKIVRHSHFLIMPQSHMSSPRW